MNYAGKSERRSSVRLKVELRVYYGDHQSKLLAGYGVDLNSGGIFLATTCSFDVHDIVKLKFSIPSQEETAAYCNARVSWINRDRDRPKPEYPVGVGLQFVDLAPEDLSSIMSFLDVEAAW